MQTNLQATACLLNCGWRLSIQLKIAILLLWLIETVVSQIPQLHKHKNRCRQANNHPSIFKSAAMTKNL